MTTDMSHAWDRVSARYQMNHAIPTVSAHYGPWAPLESELRLLGDVRGLRILEVGCGGGQCSIAFAKQGAYCAGVDISEAQLEFARALAEHEGVSVDLRHAPATDLSGFQTGEWDIVFSAYAFQYVAEIDRALAECARVLAPKGRLVFSLDHPFRDCFFDAADDEMTIYPSRSYFDGAPMRWTFADTGVPMVSYHRTFAEWFSLLGAANFTVRRLLEPLPPAELLDEIWPADDALSALRMIPQTFILLSVRGA